MGASYHTVSDNSADYGLAQPVGNANGTPFNNGMFGYFQISNIVKSPLDGNYYFAASAHGNGSAGGQQTGICMFRALNGEDLTQVTSWKAWDGSDYNADASHEELCKPVNSTTAEIRALSYNTYFGKYLAMSTGPLGFYYSLSSDLINWSSPGLLYPARTSWTASAATLQQVQALGGDTSTIAIYGTMIDHSYPYLGFPQADHAERLNFDLTGSSPYLYLVRMPTQTSQIPRSTMRVQVRFH